MTQPTGFIRFVYHPQSLGGASFGKIMLNPQDIMGTIESQVLSDDDGQNLESDLSSTF